MRLIQIAVLMMLFFGSVTQGAADINVFIYHRFDESRYPSTNIATEIFARQLSYLHENQYQVLPLSQIARMVRAGEELPDRTVGLCVDDAFTSFAQQALPLLQKYSFPATLFVNTDAVGQPGYLDWQELKDLLGQGIEIGNHTASHAYQVEMEEGETGVEWQARIRADIERSKRELKLNLGVEPEIFAYTYGEYSPALIEIIRAAGFKAAFAQQSGVIHTGADIWALPRFPMGGPYANLEGFERKLKMSALRVREVSPKDPVVREENPPELRLVLVDEALARGQLNCFAQGGNQCRVEADPQRKGGVIVRGDGPLKGRRNKYTLTALGRDGRWLWFSHLWINARRPAPPAVVQP